MTTSPTPCEYTLVEKPIIDILGEFGYRWLKPAQNELARDGLNHVLLRDVLIKALKAINGYATGYITGEATDKGWPMPDVEE